MVEGDQKSGITPECYGRPFACTYPRDLKIWTLFSKGLKISDRHQVQIAFICSGRDLSMIAGPGLARFCKCGAWHGLHLFLPHSLRHCTTQAPGHTAPYIRCAAPDGQGHKGRTHHCVFKKEGNQLSCTCTAQMTASFRGHLCSQYPTFSLLSFSLTSDDVSRSPVRRPHLFLFSVAHDSLPLTHHTIPSDHHLLPDQLI